LWSLLLNFTSFGQSVHPVDTLWLDLTFHADFGTRLLLLPKSPSSSLPSISRLLWLLDLLLPVFGGFRIFCILSSEPSSDLNLKDKYGDFPPLPSLPLFVRLSRLFSLGKTLGSSLGVYLFTTEGSASRWMDGPMFSYRIHGQRHLSASTVGWMDRIFTDP
jgi:hypothetical protein